MTPNMEHAVILRGADGRLYSVSPEACDLLPDSACPSVGERAEEGRVFEGRSNQDLASSRALIDAGDSASSRALIDAGDAASSRALIDS